MSEHLTLGRNVQAWKTSLPQGVGLVKEGLALSSGAPRLLRAGCKTP